MNDESDFSVRIKSMLRRAGLGEVPLPVLACAGVLCAVLVVFAAVHFWPAGAAHDEFETTGGSQAQVQVGGGAASSGASQALQASRASSAETGGSTAVAVDIEGAVRKPGVYELAGEARIVDAVDAAGGFAANAARTSVNLAQKVEDGMQVYVATKREAKAGAGADGGPGSGRAGSTGASAGTGGAAGNGSSGGTASSDKVNINTASAEELQKLSGIGPSLSQRIIDYRESKGPFKSIEGLKEVSGIGDTRFASIKDSVCI